MIHVELDQDVCNGFANCVNAAPHVFELDPDTNLSRVLPGRPHDDDVDDVEDAAADCPMQAIRLHRA